MINKKDLNLVRTFVDNKKNIKNKKSVLIFKTIFAFLMPCIIAVSAFGFMYWQDETAVKTDEDTVGTLNFIRHADDDIYLNFTLEDGKELEKSVSIFDETNYEELIGRKFKIKATFYDRTIFTDIWKIEEFSLVKY